MFKTLLIAKNDFEGLASAILLYQLENTELDIKLYKYDEVIDILEFNNYDKVYFVGLKNTHKYIDNNHISFKSFKEIMNHISNNNKQLYNDKAVQEFYIHAQSYIDWSWIDKKLYYGKNIDELSKYYNKISLIQTISNRVTRKQELVTDLERELIVFSKKIITDYVNKKTYNIIKKKDKLIAYAYCESNDIEFANKIMNETNADLVILFNIDKGLMRIKTRNPKYIEKNILEKGGRVNSNGGTIKISKTTIEDINDLTFGPIIDDILAGGEN